MVSACPERRRLASLTTQTQRQTKYNFKKIRRKIQKKKENQKKIDKIASPIFHFPKREIGGEITFNINLFISF